MSEGLYMWSEIKIMFPDIAMVVMICACLWAIVWYFWVEFFN